MSFCNQLPHPEVSHTSWFSPPQAHILQNLNLFVIRLENMFNFIPIPKCCSLCWCCAFVAGGGGSAGGGVRDEAEEGVDDDEMAISWIHFRKSFSNFIMLQGNGVEGVVGKFLVNYISYTSQSCSLCWLELICVHNVSICVFCRLSSVVYMSSLKLMGVN